MITDSLAMNNSRISAIGIGNGTSDSFLRTITFKGSGLFEVINDTSDIEKKVEILMKRLRMTTLDGVKFEWDASSNISYILPIVKPSQSFLKGAEMEVFVYFERGSDRRRTEKLCQDDLL